MIVAGLMLAGAVYAQRYDYEVVMKLKKGDVVEVSGDVDAYGRHKEFVDSKFCDKDRGNFRVAISERIKEDTLSAWFVTLYKGDKPLVKYAVGKSGRSGGRSADRPDKTASFKGQNPSAFSKWTNARLKYPKFDQYVEGAVRTRFTIDKEGRLYNVLIVKGSHPLLDREVFRVISKSPKWTPAQKNGQPVEMFFNFPVHFYMEN